MRTALIQMTSGENPDENLAQARDYLRQAKSGGAVLALTPEVTNCVSGNRDHQRGILRFEEDDPTLAGLRQQARDLSLWVLIGSLALKTDDADGRFANRSFLITPKGEIAARYDKIHMFDVDVSATETYRESFTFRPGNRAVVVKTDIGVVGMTVCYDVRFPHLHRALAKAGAEILTVPAAFSAVTGAAHWEALLRARAIETGCYVLAPAQTGVHYVMDGKERRTYGHSMAISPWGEILADADTDPGVTIVDLDRAEVARARARVPSLTHDREFGGP